MNHEFRARQQQARERQVAVARTIRWRLRVYYLLLFLTVMTVLFIMLFARR